METGVFKLLFTSQVMCFRHSLLPLNVCFFTFMKICMLRPEKIDLTQKVN